MMGTDSAWEEKPDKAEMTSVTLQNDGTSPIYTDKLFYREIQQQ